MKKQIILLTLIMVSTVFTGFSGDRSELSVKESPVLEKCDIMAFKAAYTYADAVFVGKVISIREEGDKKIFEFQVEKYWKGDKSKKVEVGVFETTRYAANYQVDRRYLVYAKRDDDGRLMDRRCSRSNDIDNNFAKSDIRQLGRGKIAK